MANRIWIRAICFASALWLTINPSSASADGFRFSATSSLALPDGPGSIRGMGEQFKVSFSTGAASYTIPLSLPPAHFGPSLVLQYDSAAGNGPVGLGFSVSENRLCRKTDAGVPRYALELDAFSLQGAGDIIPLASEGAWWGPRYEGSFLRAQPRMRDVGDGQGWLVRTPDGQVQVFGARAETREGPAPGEFDGTFCWLLERETDSHGRSISFIYERDGGRLYPKEIRYAEETPHPRSVRFDYEPRFDVLSDYRAGFPRETARRLSQIRAVVEHSEQTGGERTLSTYYLTYEERWNASRLVSLRMEGEHGEQLPTQRFTYLSHATGDGYEFTMQHSGFADLKSRAFRLFDADGDALPDVVRVNQAGAWGYRKNLLGKAFGAEQPLTVASGFDGSLEGVDWTHQDVDGDGYVDLLLRSDAGPNGLVWYRNEVSAKGYPEFSFQGALPQNSDTSLTIGVRLLDLNADGRPDFLHAAGGAPYAYVSSVERDGDGQVRANSTVRWEWQSSEPSSEPLDLDLSTPGVHFADMNGDGLADYLQAFGTTSSVYGVKVHFNLGGPSFGHAIWLDSLPTQIADVAPEQLQFVDLNTDGLADLVVNGVRKAKYWLNQGAARFDGPYVVEFQPADPEATITLADLNGNGSVDFVLVDPTAGDWTVYDVIGDTPVGLLSGADNGWGGLRTINYETGAMAEEEASRAGLPWQAHCPQPLTLTASYSEHTSLGDHTDMRVLYRDAYWDPEQRVFRGMRGASVQTSGDAEAPGGATDYVFFVGSRSEPSGFGGMLGEGAQALSGDTEALVGRPFSVVRRSLEGLLFDQTIARYEIRDLGNGRSLALQTGALSLQAEGTQLAPEPGTWNTKFAWPEAHPRSLEAGEETRLRRLNTQTYDEFGNMTSAASWGYVRADGSDIPGDESFEETSYITDKQQWLLRLPFELRKVDSAGRVLDRTRVYYDGDDYTGLELGKATRGVLTRRERWFDEEDRWVAVERYAHDSYGNVTSKLDALGHRVDMAYDPAMHLFCVRETSFLRAGAYASNATTGAPDTLSVEATYDLDRGALTLFRDMNSNGTRVQYDGLGRPVALFASDDVQRPVVAYRYGFGAKLSYVERIDRPLSGGDATERTRHYLDGLGRERAVLRPHESGAFSLEGLQRIGPNGLERQSFGAFLHPTIDLAELPTVSGVSSTLFRYDALGRIRETVLEDGASTRQEYRVGETIQYDADDTDPDSPHFNTPWSSLADGLGRMVLRRQTLLDASGRLATRDFRYTYDALGHLTALVLPDGSTRTFRVDSLDRVIEARDPDAGLRRRGYDDVGNIVREIDAANRQVTYSYDAIGRLRFVDHREASDALPAIRVGTFSYDVAQSGFPSNFALGRMTASVGGGFEAFHDFDARGNTVRRFVRADGRVYVTGAVYDNLDRIRVYQHADGDQVGQVYGPSGRIIRVGDVVDSADYTASGSPNRIALGNGLIVDATYDVRDRLERYTVSQPGVPAVVDLTRHYDAASIPTETIDHVVPSGALSQSAAYVYDALYRLTQVSAPAFGTLTYRYDAANSLVEQNQAQAAPPGANLGEIATGAFVFAGTDALGQHARPHQVVQAGALSYGYDANGHVTRVNSPTGTRTLSWLADGSLHQVALPDGRREVHAYDGVGKRQLTTVFDRDNHFASSTLYLNDTEEIRRKADGSAEYIKYVTFGSERIAEARVPRDVGAPANDFSAPQVAPWVASPPAITGMLDEAKGPSADFPRPPMATSLWCSVLAAAALALVRLLQTLRMQWRLRGACFALSTFVLVCVSCSGPSAELSGAEDSLWVLEGDRTYLHSGWLGTAVALTDEAGGLVSRQASTPYGIRTAEEKHDAYDRPFYFTQKERDPESGYIYFGARWYDPAVVRWLSPDPLAVWGGGSVHDASVYTYAGNRPLTSIDATGYFVLLGFQQETLETITGTGRGFLNAARETGESFLQLATHPVETLKAVVHTGANAVMHPLDTVEALYDTAVTTAHEAWDAARDPDRTRIAEMRGQLMFDGLMLGGSKVVAKGVPYVTRGVRTLSASKRARRVEKVVEKVAEKRAKPKGPKIPCILCLVTGTLVASQDGLAAIETVEVGSRVHTSAEQQSFDTAVDPDTWRLLILEMPHPSGDGRVVQLEMLRPLEWIRARGAVPGGAVLLGLPEPGLYNIAFVTDVLPCPPIASGAGRVVLTKLSYEADDIVEVSFVGSDTGLSATRGHPLFSTDRGGWVSAGELIPGEHLRAADGEIEVEAVTPQYGRYRVHNIEVESDHEYLVSELAILGHNANDPCGPGALGALEGALEHVVKRADGSIITDIDRIRGGVLWELKSASGAYGEGAKWIAKHVDGKIAKYLEARRYLPGYENAPIGMSFTSAPTAQFKALVEGAIERLRAANPGVEIKLEWQP